ncbi:unnamed protein product [Phytophthora lilii]|uniref:Unnamed protein product n=1 Tax=Phytophthora lilii TaxID=2077276 RepID=A0A9W6X2W5_9STRA|nr:unnamed protein product [Phytophthora lilii]
MRPSSATPTALPKYLQRVCPPLSLILRQLLLGPSSVASTVRGQVMKTVAPLQLSKAKHPAAARLFMSWAISEKTQTSVVLSSVRTDISTDKPWNIPEANMASFPVTAPRWSS